MFGLGLNGLPGAAGEVGENPTPGPSNPRRISSRRWFSFSSRSATNRRSSAACLQFLAGLRGFCVYKSPGRGSPYRGAVCDRRGAGKGVALFSVADWIPWFPSSCAAGSVSLRTFSSHWAIISCSESLSLDFWEGELSWGGEEPPLPDLSLQLSSLRGGPGL